VFVLLLPGSVENAPAWRAGRWGPELRPPETWSDCAAQRPQPAYAAIGLTVRRKLPGTGTILCRERFLPVNREKSNGTQSREPHDDVETRHERRKAGTLKSGRSNKK